MLRRTVIVPALLVMAVVAESCGATTLTSTGSSSSPTDKTSAGLRATAMAWSRAFLTGTVADIQAMEGVECRTGPRYSSSFLASYLRASRVQEERYLVQSLGSIRVVGVLTRNITSTSGEAEVTYDLPVTKAGNDNWVLYRYEGGIWKVANCNVPIGGESTYSHSSTTRSAGSSTSSASSPTSAQCSAGTVTERVDFGSFPSAICLDVGTTLTVSTGQGWSSVSSTDASVLHELSQSISANRVLKIGS